MRPISFAVSGIGPETARQTLASKRNVTNRNRMLFCQHKMRHRMRCRRRPLGETFRPLKKLQAPTAKLQRNINQPSPKAWSVLDFWNLEFPSTLGLGVWSLSEI